jgi:hypothetical protein
MRALRLVWPGLALTVTFVDDFIAGPVLAATGAWIGGHGGVLLGAAVFTGLVSLLVVSALLASRGMDPALQKRIDAAVAAASQRRFVGKYVRHVGDDHPWATAMVAAIVSPVLAVLLARIVHPAQRLVRTTGAAVLAYGLAFSVFYAGLGAGFSAVV